MSAGILPSAQFRALTGRAALLVDMKLKFRAEMLEDSHQGARAAACVFAESGPAHGIHDGLHGLNVLRTSLAAGDGINELPQVNETGAAGSALTARNSFVEVEEVFGHLDHAIAFAQDGDEP
jgi:hypothetical protein